MKRKTICLLCSALLLSAVFTGCGSTSAAPEDSGAEGLGATIDNTAPLAVPIIDLTDIAADDGSDTGEDTAGEGGTAKGNTADEGSTTKEDTAAEDGTEENAAAVSDFGLRLLSQCVRDGENTLISPLSVLYALGMTANGADGETLKQMEDAFGMSRQDLNSYLHTYRQSLPQGDKCSLSLANSIWVNADAAPTMQEDFLQSAVQWYDSQIYQAPFDESTRNAINDWVNENTDGMIPQILDKIPSESVLYLINALALDAEWEKIYSEDEIQDGIFTAADGTEQNVEMMYSTEQLYLRDQNAEGFIKYYNNRDLAFAALLPNEGVSVSDYVASLTGEKLQQILSTPQEIEVHAGIPKFECEDGMEMSSVLKAMGITAAFDPKTADFTSMGSTPQQPFYIDRVLHKTYIAVDEKGTRAGAATAVEMDLMSLPSETRTVNLDRPFVYMLIDCRQGNLPVFIGTLEHVI